MPFDLSLREAIQLDAALADLLSRDGTPRESAALRRAVDDFHRQRKKELEVHPRELVEECRLRITQRLERANQEWDVAPDEPATVTSDLTLLQAWRIQVVLDGLANDEHATAEAAQALRMVSTRFRQVREAVAAGTHHLSSGRPRPELVGPPEYYFQRQAREYIEAPARVAELDAIGDDLLQVDVPMQIRLSATGYATGGKVERGQLLHSLNIPSRLLPRILDLLNEFHPTYGYRIDEYHYIGLRLILPGLPALDYDQLDRHVYYRLDFPTIPTIEVADESESGFGYGWQVVVRLECREGSLLVQFGDAPALPVAGKENWFSESLARQATLGRSHELGRGPRQVLPPDQCRRLIGFLQSIGVRSPPAQLRFTRDETR